MAELPDRGVLARRVLADRAAAGALDAMRWSDLARLYTPVTATPQPRARVVPLAETDPDSGTRWGRPSAFSYSNEAAKQSPDEQSITNTHPVRQPGRVHADHRR